MNLMSWMPSAFGSGLFTAAAFISAPAASWGAEFAPQGEVLRIDRIWADAEHSAFTDLIRHRERWFCTFREGAKHASPDGVITSLGYSF